MRQGFDAFRELFARATSARAAAAPWEHPNLLAAAGYREFAVEFAGTTFGDGLYRVHDATSGPSALEYLQTAFPDLAPRLTPFAFDWLGTQFALDTGRVHEGQPQVMMLEPGTGQALEVPVSFESFHSETIPLSPDAALGLGFFEQWASSDPEGLPLAFTDCVGYRIPLFLGGGDSLANLEKTDIDVYWTIAAELIRAVRELPEGAPFAGVRIDDP